MAAEPEKTAEGEGGGKKKLIIIGAAVLVVVLGGAGFFLMGGNDAPAAATEDGAAITLDEPGASSGGKVEMGDALYVAMPRPFVFNVPGASRDRLVQIKVQLLVRGSDNEESAKKHIPLIEGTLLKEFSSSNADDLGTMSGKDALKANALKALQDELLGLTGKTIIEKVLFTGFVMQ